MALKKYSIEGFIGLDQSVDENRLAPAYSPNAANMRTDGGKLSTARGYIKYISKPIPGTGRIRFLTYYRGSESQFPVVIAGSDIYAYKGGDWLRIHSIAGSMDNVRFDAAMIRINTTDHLVIADGKRRLIKFDGTSVTPFGSREGCSDMPIAFLTMYRGRLFAAGDPQNPDRLYYSVLPGSGRTLENWGYVEASPAVEGGHAEVGSGGGDPIIGIYALSNQLLIFKKHELYRLIGDRPSNFTIEHIDTSYLTPRQRAIAAYGDVLFFLTQDGLYYYNGVTARPSADMLKIRNIMANASTLTSELAIIGNTLYFSIRTGGDDQLIEYNIPERKYMLRDGFGIRAMVGIPGGLLFTNDQRYIYLFDRGSSYDGDPINARWSLPAGDLGDKAAIKGLRELYLRGSGGYINVTTRTDGHMNHYRRRMPASSMEVLEIPLLNEGRCIGLTIANEGGGELELIGGLELLLELRNRTE